MCGSVYGTRSGREVPEGGAGHLWGQQDSFKVCIQSDRWVPFSLAGHNRRIHQMKD